MKIAKLNHEFCGYLYTIYKEGLIYTASPNVGQDPCAAKNIKGAIDTYLEEINYGFRNNNGNCKHA